MKKQIFFILMLLVSVMAVGQTVPRCKTCNAYLAKCPYKGKHPVEAKCGKCGKVISKCPYKGKHPAEKPKEQPQQKQRPQSRPRANMVTVPGRTFDVKGVKFTMAKIDGGTFTMGATSEQGSDARDSEKPAHQVTLSSYHIGQTEVTQELWEAVMGSNPSRFKGAKRPVECVTWNDCQRFLDLLNSLTGEHFRLPTEAEWEYACRGGKYSNNYKYSGSNSIGDVAWYDGNSNSETHNVATKKPNELGIYDMSGNVLEWCQDWEGSYSSNAQTNPTGPSSGSLRVLRGGGWYDFAEFCRSSYRGSYDPDDSYYFIGMRLALPVY